jgi:hypothetical protein
MATKRVHLQEANDDADVDRAVAAGELFTRERRPTASQLTRLIERVTARLNVVDDVDAAQLLGRLRAHLGVPSVARWFSAADQTALLAACRVHQRAVLENTRLSRALRSEAAAALVSHAPALVLSVHAAAPIAASIAWRALVARVATGESGLDLDGRRDLAWALVDEAPGMGLGELTRSRWPASLELLRSDDAVAVAAAVIDRHIDNTGMVRWLVDHSPEGRVAVLARIDKVKLADRLYLLEVLEPAERFDLVKELWSTRKTREILATKHVGLLADDDAGLDLALGTMVAHRSASIAVLEKHRSPRATAELENAARIALVDGRGTLALEALERRCGAPHVSAFLAQVLDGGTCDQSIGWIARALVQFGLPDDVDAVERALVRGVNDRSALLQAAESMRSR